MKKKLTVLFIGLFISNVLLSQVDPFFKQYDWETNPKYEIVDNNEDIVSLKDKIVTEFYFENNSLVEYFLEHKVLWLNSDEKIEDYNKVYLPHSSSSELVINKARVIDEKGNIIELDKSKILTASDEETGKKYKYFAFEGLKKGSFIEYFYVQKKTPSYQGRKLYLQSSFDKKNVEFDLLSPKNLVFKFKSFNGIPSVVQDTLIKEKQHWKLRVKDIKKLEKEYKSAYNASRGFVAYKLDKNTVRNLSNIISYKKVAQNIYKFYYPSEYEKKTTSLINKVIKEVNIKENDNIDDQLRKLDLFVKSNFYISDFSNNELEDLDVVLEKKVMNNIGAIKFYVAIIKALGIKHELVITSDRLETKFDKEFEANNFLNDFLFYFPKNKKYLDPTNMESRFGFPPGNSTDNYGLFIKEVIVGDFKSAVGRIKYIKPVSAENTVDRMFINVTFNADNISECKVKLEREFSGYYAMSIQPFMNLIQGDKRKELVDGIAKSISKNIEITKREVENDSPEMFGVKPLKFTFDFTTETFVEKAGKKYLFKLGELIGPQIQMYQEKERVLPLEEDFQRSYYRTIVVNIPRGYKLTNLEDININNAYNNGAKELFSFKSFYNLEGNKLEITADEHYRENLIEVNLYEKYRKVINSAADFNKIVLLLEPDTKK